MINWLWWIITRRKIMLDDHGNAYWYKANKLHRDNGPAVIKTNGTCYWYLNGRLHRLDGPAIEYSDGRVLYYLNNTEYTENEWKFWKKIYE